VSTAATAPRRANVGFMLRRPSRWIALGFGSGLSPLAPGTVGTLWAWVAFLVIDRWLDATGWAVLIAGSWAVGWWACTQTARDLATADPGQIVWDEVVAFWLVLWLVMPAGFWMQVLAFGLFRYFDAAKPGPVRWADQLCKHSSSDWAIGFGILFDDLVAAGCTLIVIAAGVAIGRAW
jgi:phosphatidylglycerophosphatase A